MGGAWPVGGVRRTTTTSRAAAALFAKTKTANRDRISGRAAARDRARFGRHHQQHQEDGCLDDRHDQGGPSRILPGTRT